MPSLRMRSRKNEAAAQLPPLPRSERGLPVDPLPGAVDFSSTRSCIREASAPAPSRAARFVSGAASAVRRVIPSVGRRSQSAARLAPLNEATGTSSHLAPLAPLGRAGSTPRFDLRPSCPWEKDDATPSFAAKPLAQGDSIGGRDLRPSLPWVNSSSSKDIPANISDKSLQPGKVPTPCSRGSESKVPSLSLQAVALRTSLALSTDSEASFPESIQATDGCMGDLAVDVKAYANGAQVYAGISNPLSLPCRGPTGEVDTSDSASRPSSLAGGIALDTKASVPVEPLETDASNSPCWSSMLDEMSAPAEGRNDSASVYATLQKLIVEEPLRAIAAPFVGSEEKATPSMGSSKDDMLVPNLPDSAAAAEAAAKGVLKCKVQEEFLAQCDRGVTPTSATIAALHLCAKKIRSEASITSETRGSSATSQERAVPAPLEADAAPFVDGELKAPSSMSGSKEDTRVLKPPGSKAEAAAKNALKCKVQKEFLVQCDLGASPTSATIAALHHCTKMMRREASELSLKKSEEPTIDGHARSSKTLEEIMSPKRAAVAAC